MTKTNTLIIGAGISGLMAAEKLKSAGETVMLLDKGRGYGGRMATRRIENGRADHGAQFFTVRSPEFGAHVEQWLADGLIYQWSSGWSGDPAQDAKADGYPRYAGSNGMTTVPKALAKKHAVRNQTRVVQITAVGDGWQATDEAGTRYEADKLIMTPPVPQSLALLDAGGVQLAPNDRAALERIRYNPCLAGLFLVDGNVNLPAPGALQRPDHDYSWIADNQRKGISPDARLITVHANAKLSWTFWDAPQGEQVEMLLAGLRPFLPLTTTIQTAQAHRWRYAQPSTLHPERTLLAQNLPPLAFAGDAFKEARVEGAALSGMAAAASLGVISP